MNTSTGSRLVRLLPRDGYEVPSNGAVRGSANLQPTIPVLGAGFLLVLALCFLGGEPGAASSRYRLGNDRTIRPLAVSGLPVAYTVNVVSGFADYQPSTVLTDALHEAPASNTATSVSSPCVPPSITSNPLDCHSLPTDSRRLCRVVAARRLGAA